MAEPVAATDITEYPTSQGKVYCAAVLDGSMGRVASSVDNTMMESFWLTMQGELLDRQNWSSKDEFGSVIFE